MRLLRLAVLIGALILPAPILAQDADARLRDAVDGHILPGFRSLDSAASALSQAAAGDCSADAPALRNAFGTAFDAWISVSHLRFGPTETGDRAFALAFWPDPRGTTPDALRRLITAEDPVAADPAAFAQVSVAARGLYALEYLLYDADFRAQGSPAYRCALIRAIAADIAANAAAIRADWEGGYGADLAQAGSNARFRTVEEAMQELLKAITGGLGLTAEARLERPMGTFDAPRPARAEARRSGRSLRHVVLSLAATRDLARRIAPPGPAADATDAAFARALSLADGLDDPVLAGVADPQGRLKVEILLAAVKAVLEAVETQLGPALGVTAGFNSADGD